MRYLLLVAAVSVASCASRGVVLSDQSPLFNKEYLEGKVAILHKDGSAENITSFKGNLNVIKKDLSFEEAPRTVSSVRDMDQWKENFTFVDSTLSGKALLVNP